ncbi:MAG TPA: sigma-70 family RNA polymerase sigma factor [Opitutales bacterium]|nr:sigma-70 family RNA polymerase sigma factor [Opitutales bacterium]
MTPDNELLRLYTEQGDQAAFAEVVRRQVDLVYSAALRVVNGDTHLAEDVTQTVFTALAHDAHSLAGHPSIVGWLHTTARHTAIKAVRGEFRRRIREQEASAMQNLDSVVAINWEQIRPSLDEAIGQLSDRDREAILLRFFKGLGHREVGEVLGLTEDAARKCVERALEKMRENFFRRGIVVSAILLAEILPVNSVEAAPMGLGARVACVSTATVGSVGATSFLWKILSMSTKTKTLLTIAGLALAAAITMVMHSRGNPVVTPNASAAATLVSSKPAAVDASMTSTRVEAPKVTATQPMTTPAMATGTAGSVPAKVDPRLSLSTAIPEAVRLLQAQDLVGFYNEFVQPQRLDMTGVQFDALVRQDKNFQQDIDELTQIFQSLQALTPEMDASGERATFKGIKRLSGASTDYVFYKKDGLWYFEFH